MIGYRMNGYTIVAAQPASLGNHYVILGHGKKPETGNRFVTALVHETTLPTPTEWWNGYYVDDPEKAVASYYDRATTMPEQFIVGVTTLVESLADNEWVHLDGTPCKDDVVHLSGEGPNIGVCDEHDRRVRRRVPR